MTARSKKSTHPKDNAKGRRKKENKELLDLASQLPLPVTVATQLDKASVIRLATAYLKLRRLFPGGLGRGWGEECSASTTDTLPELGKFLNKALHGFVFILGADATILYISEEASAQLGFSQVQLTGKSFWSYVHSSDAKELKTILCFEMDIPAFNVGNSILEDLEIPRSFTVRMKCILPKRQAELAVDRYKVIHCRGYVKLKRKSVVWDTPSGLCYEMTGVVASGHSLSPTPSAEIKLHRRDFMFRTGLDLQFLYIEPKSQKIIGYEPTQLQDKSLYKFIHPCDCEQMKQVHESAVTKSQAVSSYYRFLTRNGGWIWIQSSCVVITNNKTDHSQCILFVNSVLSEREHTDITLAVEQLTTPDSEKCNPSKRSGTSFKRKRKTSSMVLEDSSPSDRNSVNTSPHQITDQGFFEVPLFGSDNNHFLNLASGFAQKSNLFKSLQITPELNCENYAAISGVFNGPGMFSDYAGFPYLEPAVDQTDLLRDYNLAMHTTSSEMYHQNLTAESSPTPNMLNLNAENEQVTLHSTPITADNSIPESNKDLSPCVSFTSTKDYRTNNPSQNNLIFWPLTNLNRFSQKLSQKLDNSCDLFSPNVSQPNELGKSTNSASARSISRPNHSVLSSANQHINQFYNFNTQEEISCHSEQISANSGDIKSCKNSHGVSNLAAMCEGNQTRNFRNYNLFNHEKVHESAEYDFCSLPSNQIVSCLAERGDSRIDHFDAYTNGALSSKTLLPGENVDSFLTEDANAERTDHDDNPQKSFHSNSKPAYDNKSTPMVISTVEQSTLRGADTNDYYVLSSVPSRTTAIETPSFPYSTKDAPIPTCNINNISVPMATASTTVAIDDCTNELYTPKIIANHQVLADTSTISSLVPNTSYNFTCNVSEVPLPSKDSLHGHTTVGNEYLSLLKDQWAAVYSQSATNVRSESASSVSLGYASESSYMDQSSPFSTYCESSFS